MLTGGVPQNTQNVSWTNTNGVSINGNSLTKTTVTDWGNGGASSSQAISSGDGYVEFTASETTTSRMIGLSNGDTNQGYQDIDFAAYLDSHNLCVYEAAVSRGCYSTFVSGDIIRVAVENGVVKYKKNGAVVYTSSVTPTYPLIADTALWSHGATINNAVISGNITGGAGSNIRWLVTDQLGTPRMIVDQTGSLTGIKRHDYLPFGDEIGSAQVALIGGRSGTPGYASDSVRQKFTGYESDPETGLYYAQARYQSSVQGRFTGVDPLGASANIGDPQSFNRYSYVQNSPLTAVDPTGMALSDIGVYQTHNPEVADIIQRKTTPRPQPHRKNPILPKPKPVKVDQNNLPPPPGGPVSAGPVNIDTGTPPPSSINVSVIAGPLQAGKNEPWAPGVYATGVRSILTIKITDQDGKPLVGWKIEESNSTLESVPGLPKFQNPSSATTSADGTIEDAFGANMNLSTYRLNDADAKAAVYKQIESKSHWLVEQTLKISSPDGGVVAIAVYRRRISNLANGDITGVRLPALNSIGNHVNNFHLRIFPVSVTYPARQR